MTKRLVFETMGGATIEIDLEKCKKCDSKACVEACNKPHMGSILGLDENGMPQLVLDEAKVNRGACTDCLACELDCELYGNKALKITLEMPDLDRHLKVLKEKGENVVYWE